MPTSATEPGGGEILVSFAGADGAPGHWLLVGAGGIVARGAPGEHVLLAPGMRTALAVPGSEVAIHWLDLAGDLTPAQAAAAARLMLADASAEPLSEMHVAAGRREGGLTPVALVPHARMDAWLAPGLDPDMIVPGPLLILPPAQGLACRDAGAVPDYRGVGAAFSVEPELAALLAGDAPIAAVDEEAFEAGLCEALSPPLIDLRQEPYARRRQWRIERRSLHRAALLAAALAVLTLVLQVATIMRYTFDADRLEAEAAALGPAAAGPTARPGFGSLAAILFQAVQATPNLELTRLEYRLDGSLAATVQVDSPATLAAFRSRAEAGGAAVEGGAIEAAGGRPTAELVLRPA